MTKSHLLDIEKIPLHKCKFSRLLYLITVLKIVINYSVVFGNFNNCYIYLPFKVKHTNLTSEFYLLTNSIILFLTFITETQIQTQKPHKYSSLIGTCITHTHRHTQTLGNLLLLFPPQLKEHCGRGPERL